MTDPDWNSIMTIAGAVLTDEAGTHVIQLSYQESLEFLVL